MKITASNKTAIDYMVPLGLGSLVFYNIYKKGGDYKQAGMVALITAGVAYAIVTQLTKQALLASVDKISTTEKAQIATQYGASTVQIDAAQARAKAVHVAFYGTDGNAWTEDEGQAIAVVNQCATPTDVQLTCQLYQSTYGKSLQADFDGKVHFWDGSINSIVTANWF